MLLKDLPVVDIYLGHDYSLMKDLPGAHAPGSAAPVELKDELASVRGQCLEMFRTTGDPEFALSLDGFVYRVTTFVDTSTHPVFVLSRASTKVIPIERLDIPRHAKEAALAPRTRGIVLVTGEMGSGKTTTATTLFTERLRQTRSIGLALEDPIESNLNGPHGEGWCIHVQVSRKEGGYREYLIRSMRSRAETIYLGELRDESSAEQAVQLSNMGHLVFTTAHGGDLQQAIDRILSMSRGLRDPSGMLAEGLAVIIHQRLIPSAGTPGSGSRPRLIAKALTLVAPDGDKAGEAFAKSARALIRANDLSKLQTLIEQQSNAASWRGNS
ncbi:GspE family protein (plasmid) [Stenotrophomonas maltophilia]|uniref:ATPase, T2SS/T4P/T4SS family n=1 Tax=Stenotrophomonas maltophilia TaxID=40324 RepID=UPI001D0C06DD|nr:ATPase, T2SS/T4P/T4SS family [Stenotrophomonas maltophilia]UXF74684.1 GspE family protein [Stenotrophomonas maltophilia]